QPCASDVEDVASVDALVDQGFPHRQAGVYVTSGTGGGYGDPDRPTRTTACHAFPPCWLMLTSTPNAPIVATRAVLPKLTKGNAIPVIGITPSTPPMFINA